METKDIRRENDEFLNEKQREMNEIFMNGKKIMNECSI